MSLSSDGQSAIAGEIAGFMRNQVWSHCTASYDDDAFYLFLQKQKIVDAKSLNGERRLCSKRRGDESQRNSMVSPFLSIRIDEPPQGGLPVPVPVGARIMRDVETESILPPGRAWGDHPNIISVEDLGRAVHERMVECSLQTSVTPPRVWDLELE
jgi:hypothetical protein